MMDKWDTVPGLTPQVKADLREMERTFGQGEGSTLFEELTAGEEGRTMSRWQEEQDEVIVIEPILPKKDCRVEIGAAETAEWTVNATSDGGAPGYEGQTFPAMKLTVTITDESIQTEHENARPRLTIEHQLNLARYPYLDKKSGTVRFLGRQHLFDLEEALGFDPVFTNGEGQSVEPYITRTGRKVAPKGEGIKRQPNPAFLSAYFHPDGSPTLEWNGKTVYTDIEIEANERYGDRNRIVRFKRAPVSV